MPLNEQFLMPKFVSQSREIILLKIKKKVSVSGSKKKQSMVWSK